MAFGLDAAGYFTRDGKRIWPVGANYWPGSAGVEMWARFEAVKEEIARDLDLVKSLGLNTVRFFLRWQDFEPEEGKYDERQFANLRTVLEMFRARGLYAHPSLFVGFMSGGLFWPKWKKANLYSPGVMRERSMAFTKRAMGVIAEFKDCVVAVDQGNELCCLAESSAALPEDVVGWCGDINAAIRSVWRDAIIISGNEQNQVINDTGWRFGQQPGCDLYSMHGYPVPGWHNVMFDGMTDPFCQSLLPFYTKVARAYGPVMLQEFGTIVTFGAKQQRAYLEKMLPKALESGANGFLWWCMRDITAPVHPYMSHGFEGTLGLVDAAGKVKPGLEVFIEFCRSLATRPLPTVKGDAVGVYLPAQYYQRNVAGAPNNPQQFSRWLIVANFLSEMLGHEVRVVRGDQPLPGDLKMLIVPSILLCVPEAEAIAAWVKAGGKLLWHGVDPVNFGAAYIELLGALPVDYRQPKAVTCGGMTFDVFPRNMRVEIEPRGCEVVSRDADGLPVLVTNKLGRGKVVAALPLVDETIARAAPDFGLARQWYEKAFALLKG